jgi:diguanylate cyclase (GGDEF)-like protein
VRPGRDADVNEADAFRALGSEAAIVDSAGRILSTNRAWDLFQELNGGDASCGVGGDYLATCRASGESEVADAIAAVASGERPFYEIEYPCPSPWEDRWFLLQASALASSGAVVANVNITRHKQLEHRLVYQAGHDELTGLANRTVALAHARQAVLDEDPVAIVFVDLNGFKQINDEQGHASGDEVLMLVATRLERVVRGGDTLARHGGDEFVIVCVQCTPEQASGVAERVEAAFVEPFQLGSRTVTLTASVGLAFGVAGQTVEELFAAADAAMYRDKRNRRRER